MYYEIAGANTRILGSIHFLSPGTGAFPAWVWSAFHWSEVIEKEHDGEEFAAYFYDPQTKALKPWGAMFIKLGQAFNSVNLPLGVETVFSSALQATARPPMTYLESGRSIGDLMDAVPVSDIAAADAAMDAAMPQMIANIGALHSAWERSDVTALEALQTESPLGSIPTMRHAFFTARNENWARTIATRGPSEKRQLLVVGAMHLVGPESLLETLSRCGLEARRLPS